MKNKINNEFHKSLDITNDELEQYIPKLLKGLWELGSMPEYIIELIERNIKTEFNHVIDLGCGKGAVLIRLAERFEIKGLGVDIIPDFIEEAKSYAKKYAVTDKVEFRTEDLIETIRVTSDQDIAIYGYDSEILGDLNNTLKQLSGCIKDDGLILLEFMFSDKPHKKATGFMTEKEMLQSIEAAGFNLLDRINWDREILRQTNIRNTAIIKNNVEELSRDLPEKKAIFEEYLLNQIAECEELENHFTCTTLLLSR